MKYSIIIAVYNRIDEVKELLASAEEMTFDKSRYEIFFVDDGSTDGFKEYVMSYTENSALNIQCVYQSNQGPGAARNHGMQEAVGEYFIFVDSDCLFPPQWLDAVDEALSTHGFDAFGGPDRFHPSFSPMIKAIDYSMTSFLGTGGTRGGKRSVGKFYPRSFNMGIARKVYDRIGGMNALRHGQDMDYSARIYEAGFKVGLISEAFVYHKRRTNLWKFFKQIFNWGVARINLQRLHPSLLKPIHALPAIVVMSYVLAVILGLSIASLRPMLWCTLIGHGGICALAFKQATIKYRRLDVGLLSIGTLNIQVFAYGMGFLYAVVQRMIGRKEAHGFVKHYYSKNNTTSR